MNRLFCLLGAMALVAGLQTVAARQITAQGEKLLAAAQHKATVDGDLKAAIEDYKKIVASAGANRPLAAQALVQMAECYQKLGDVESRKIYERVLKEYADQADAVSIASARLGRIKSAAGETGIVTRQVWTGPNVDFRPGAVSADGRFIVYTDWSASALMLHDLTAGTDRPLVKNEYASELAVSPDGKQVAYSWRSKGRWGLRVLGIDEAATAAPRALRVQDGITGIDPCAWSPDGRWIAVQFGRADGTRYIGLMNPSDSLLRTLKSVDRLGSTRLSFSPDGRFVAFDVPSGERPETRDVFVLAVDQDREIPAVVHPANDVVIGWMPDGRYLLFASDRGGSKGLWALPWADGKTRGEPELIKTDIDLEAPLGVTRAGILYYGVTLSARDVYVAEIDATTGAIVSRPVRLIEEFVGGNSSPDWSPDGRSLAYISRGTVLAIRSMDTGQTRELRPELSRFFTPRWAPDGRSFAVDGTDDKGQHGIYRIDAQSGHTSLIVQVQTSLAYLDWFPDGQRIVYRENHPDTFRVVEHDIDARTQRELVRGNVMTVSLSPDGRRLAYSTRPPWRLTVVPTNGGEAREVRLPSVAESIMVVAWTPDSRSILLRVAPASGESASLWLISPDGGLPRNVDLDPNIIPLSRMFNRRTNQVAFTADTSRREVWMMDHFLLASSVLPGPRRD